MEFWIALGWLLAGGALLIIGGEIFVRGATALALLLKVPPLIIGLTIVAVGTSLPELASSVIAARKGQNDLALGNILGSNIFNTLAVVGIAGVIRPLSVEPEVLSRDLAFCGVLTLALTVMGISFRGREGRINRVEGAVFMVSYAAYIAGLILQVSRG